MRTKIRNADHCFVIEIGGSKISLCLVQLNGTNTPTIIGQPKIINSMVARGPDETARSCLTQLPAIAAAAGILLADIPLISVTIPAPVSLDQDGGATVADRSNLGHDGWKGTDFAAVVTKLASSGQIAEFSRDLRVYGDNDAKAAGAGVLREFDPDVVASSTFHMLFFGTGIGGVTIINGQIVRGVGLAGEPGNTLINFPDEPTYWKGKRKLNNRRPFEHFAARVGLARQLEQIFDTESRCTLHPLRKVQLEAGDECSVWQKRAGRVREIANTWVVSSTHDPHEQELCIGLIDGCAHATAIYLAQPVLALNPHFIVLGGGLTDRSLVSQAFNDRFAGLIAHHLDPLVMANFRSKRPWGYKFHFPNSGDAAAVIGAADLAHKFWIGS